MIPEYRSFRSLRLGIDLVSCGFLALLLLLAVLFPGRIPGATGVVLRLVLAACLYGAATLILRKLRPGFTVTLGYVAAVLLLFTFLFQIVSRYQQLIVDGWLDARLIAWEEALTGTEMSVLLQEYTYPWLTEWMMFAYVIYVPLLPGVALLCYRAAGPEAAMDYLLNLAAAYVVCYVGFMFFPVAGPLFHYPERFSVPLAGWVFTWCGEWIRANAHYPGGNLPSPHCAAATVMMVLLFRYDRRAARVLLLIFLTIYASTVYGRYHYSSDVVTGILTAVVVLKFSPAFVRQGDRLVSGIQPVLGRMLDSVKGKSS